MTDLSAAALADQIRFAPSNDPRVLAIARWFVEKGWDIDIDHLKVEATATLRHGTVAPPQLNLIELVQIVCSHAAAS